MKMFCNNIYVIGIFLLFPCLLGTGCASVPDTTMTFTDLSDPPRRNAPLRDVEYQETAFNFGNNLPLGIGGRFDLFLSETATDVNDFYDSYIRPMRQGKFFAKSAMAVDYSILPMRGEVFSNQNGDFQQLKDVSVRSDYKLQIGMSRRFHNFGDFLKPEFWMAQGEYAPSSPVQKEMPEPLIKTLGDEDYIPGGEAGDPIANHPDMGLLSPEDVTSEVGISHHYLSE